MEILENMINIENIHTLLIDLDDTIYPADSPLWPAVRGRIDLYLHERLGFPAESTCGLRERLFNTYGTTLRGLQTEYEVDKEDYLNFVHDVQIRDYLKPDPELYPALSGIPQRKIIFTNATAKHAKNVLDCLGLSTLFNGIIDIEAIDPYCKPEQQSFEIAMRLAGESNPKAYLFVDDNVNNLLAGQALGMSVIHVGEMDHSPVPSIKRLADIQSLLDGFT